MCSGLESTSLHLSLIRHCRELVRNYLMIPLENAEQLKLKLLLEKGLIQNKIPSSKTFTEGGFIT